MAILDICKTEHRELDSAMRGLETTLRQAHEEHSARCDASWKFQGESLARTCLGYLMMSSDARAKLAAEKRMYIQALQQEIARVTTILGSFPLIAAGSLVLLATTLTLYGIVKGLWARYRVTVNKTNSTDEVAQSEPAKEVIQSESAKEVQSESAEEVQSESAEESAESTEHAVQSESAEIQSESAEEVQSESAEEFSLNQPKKFSLNQPKKFSLNQPKNQLNQLNTLFSLNQPRKFSLNQLKKLFSLKQPKKLFILNQPKKFNLKQPKKLHSLKQPPMLFSLNQPKRLLSRGRKLPNLMFLSLRRPLNSTLLMGPTALTGLTSLTLTMKISLASLCLKSLIPRRSPRKLSGNLRRKNRRKKL
ncbi:uncharacterized protein LOC119584347 [Penaeus monodon]|uniref:uncharacterized protein LOC119584347 n=1 Tax=Penaeus monodon TaxID=6687 RepID=UPI0018A7CEC5|nr:uncharacterized protein LOC119584347 [Penaeus monodon]